MVMAAERLIIFVVFASWAWVVVTAWAHDGNAEQLKRDTLEYLTRRNVNYDTCLQVVHHMQDAGFARHVQQNSEKVLSKDIPIELRRALCEELWASRLMSMGLIMHVAHWNENFIVDLALLVHDVVYTRRSAVCREGDAATTAFLILSGVIGEQTDQQFTEGMWIGEQTLINPGLRRTETMIVVELSEVMVVPADGFHELLDRLDLAQDFKTFCTGVLWKGFCGRCGTVGDHFPNACPRLVKTKRDLGVRVGPIRQLSRISERFWRCMRWSKLQRRTSMLTCTSSELRAYLHANHLVRFLDILENNSVFDLDDLMALGAPGLRAILPAGVQLSAAEEAALSEKAVVEFRNGIHRDTVCKLFHNVSNDQHFIYISHHHSHAGGNLAVLLSKELAKAASRDAGSFDHHFRIPVTLSVDASGSFEERRELVERSHNFLLLLTDNVLQDTVCLMEVVWAVNAGVRVLPVNVMSSTNRFVFPDEPFYMRLRDGKLLPKSDEADFQRHHINVDDVAHALTQLFAKISAPYSLPSPRISKMLRDAQLQSIRSLCRLKQTVSSSSTNSEQNIRIIFSHASRDKSEVATGQVEAMINVFERSGISRSRIMYQYSMDIAPGKHWADIWMTGLHEAEVVIVMMEQAYLKSEACVKEYLCSQDKTQAIVLCNPSELPALRHFKPKDGATGCGGIVMQLSTGTQLYIRGAEQAAVDIAERYLQQHDRNVESAGGVRQSTGVQSDALDMTSI